MHIFIDIKKDTIRGGDVYIEGIFFFMKNSYIGTFIYINQIKKTRVKDTTARASLIKTENRLIVYS